MAHAGGVGLFSILTGMLVAVAILPAFLSAGPTGRRLKGDDGVLADATTSASRKLSRSRRNISWYNQHSDFWGWYKYFTDTGNQEGVQELDRVYLAYLKNKNRAEGRRSYNLYLRHLGDIYKSCAETNDPNCVASYIGRPVGKAEAPRSPSVKACDPYRDPYCGVSQPRVPAPVWVPPKAVAPSFFYAPALSPLLSTEQQAELLRICDSKDVECLQYHLRAAYGYQAALGPAPSYAYLGCDPQKDPGCGSRPIPKAPSGLYQRYTACDPRYDPYCLNTAAQSMQAPPCNPLHDNNCNPLTGARLAGPERHAMDDPTACDPRYDPYCQQGRPAQPDEDPRHRLGPRGKTKEGYDCYVFYDEDCVPLDLASDAQSSAASRLPDTAVRPAHGSAATCHPLDPSCGGHPPPQQSDSGSFEPHLNLDGTRNSGIVEPDPDCDPEYDRNCRLRRAEEPVLGASAARERKWQGGWAPEEERDVPVQHKEPHYQGEAMQDRLSYATQPDGPAFDPQMYEPYQSGQEDPYASYSPQEHTGTQLEDIMGEYSRYDEAQDHRAYSGEYRKK
ncbi:uncharacterized protein [Paramormyrops kingsleyae]|uniref:Actinodin1 n=1 Tax=Paramormyrops kingsleyae TaxID=1676925 RepID=A0A3B3Q3I9_9TELE|nr:uncharacterized protein LOC111838083 [Paramormyrops kingsleyae]